MPKPYIRKSDRGAAYTQEQLKEAVQKVKNGTISAYAASKLYGIPRPTIVNRVYNRKGLKSNTLGRPTALSMDEEKTLAENLHIMEKYGFGLTRKELLEVVGQYVVENDIETPFKNGVPGEDWFLAFKKRHDLSVKKPQPVEYARKKACSPAVIYPYFDLLETTIDELGLRDKPAHIWNCDETSFSKDPTKSKVVGLRGFTSTRTISSPGKTNTTVLLACNAAGEKAPPLIVYKGKSVWDTWTSEDGYPGTRYAATPNGWMETSVFEKFIEKIFLPVIGEKRPILLIYDGHSTHLGINVIQKARDNNITILKIPPHSSDNLQPLDLAVNKSFKDKWDVALVKWQRLNVGKVLPKNEFSRIIGQVWTQIDPLVCAAGFRKAGIYPLNKNAIPENKFDPVLLAEWKKSATLTKETNTGMSERPETSTNQPVKIPTNNETSKRPEASMDQLVKKPNILKKIALASVNKLLFEAQVAPRHISLYISLENSCPISINDVLNKRSQEKDAPLADIGNVQQRSKVQILDDRPVITNIKFEQLLLKSVKPGKLCLKTNRKKVAAGAEVITHDEVYERYKVIEAEKQKKIIKQGEKKAKREKQITKDSENKNEGIPGPSGVNRKRKIKKEFSTMTSKKGKGVGKKSQVCLKENLKNVKLPAKKKYRKRSSSTSVSDCVSLDDDSDIEDVGLKDLIDENLELLDEDFDIAKNLGYKNCMQDSENNDITGETCKTTEIVVGSEERTMEAEAVSNITGKNKNTTEVVGESQEKNIEAGAVIGNIKDEINKATGVVRVSNRRKMVTEIRIDNINYKRNKVSEGTTMKSEEVVGDMTGERKKATEVVSESEGRNIEAGVVIGNITDKRNEVTMPVRGSKGSTMVTESVDGNWHEKIEEEENYEINDNVMVRYYTKNKWTYYIGYITTILSPRPNGTYEIRYYKTCKKPLKFKLTKKLDRDTVPALSIVKKVHLLEDLKNSKEFLLSDEEDFIYFS